MSKITDKLITSLQSTAKSEKTGEYLKVSSVVSKAAKVYEKIRNAVDLQEEHLIRKNAIYRILKRKLLFEKVIFENYLLDKYHHENLAQHLLQELIRGGYIRSKVLVTKVVEVDKIIQKYNLLLAKIKEVEGKVNKKEFRYFLEMAAVEIEFFLNPPDKEKAVVQAIFSAYNKQIVFKDKNINEKEKELQLYIASFRILFKWDQVMLRTMLWNLYYPEWKNANQALILKLANNINSVKAEFNKQLFHPWAKPMNKILQRKAIIFWILQDMIEENGNKINDIFADPEELEAETKKAINKRYKGVGQKLSRGVFRSIIYVFFTKMLLAIGLEFPMDIYIGGAVNYFTAMINICFPPILMFMVAIMIRMPKTENTNEILSEVKWIVQNQGEAKTYKLKDPKIRGKSAKFIFNFIYLLSFIFSICVIFYVLNNLDFNFFSSLIFVLFLTLVSFFGIRIRKPVQDLLAIDRRESVISVLIDFFALPFVSMGRWMSVKFSKINVFALVLDVIIEAPFKLLIEIFEDLFGFIKEKKDEVMDD